MKKVSSNLLNFLAIFFILLTSCSHDADISTPPYVGNWRLIKWSGDEYSPHYVRCNEVKLSFKPDNTGTISVRNYEYDDDYTVSLILKTTETKDLYNVFSELSSEYYYKYINDDKMILNS
ncbi:hypothetical protein GN157_05150 [Flavobacterium rakeshii]|uniref:Lipocalin-like domain-containing protein n=1 Tax=Flavobacterium rakeshii TaxID=1038845 RepID=A0A6N8H9B5_9FLAO|nr:hypothetical protein [Flavobacterium rakeshii]MUV03091.1 hypothetical protein [Flavobacterium rakeshii]